MFMAAFSWLPESCIALPVHSIDCSNCGLCWAGSIWYLQLSLACIHCFWHCQYFDLHCNLGFTFIILCTGLSGASCKKYTPASSWLAEWVSETVHCSVVPYCLYFECPQSSTTWAMSILLLPRYAACLLWTTVTHVSMYVPSKQNTRQKIGDAA